MQQFSNQGWRQNINHLLDAVEKVARYSDAKEILQTVAIQTANLLNAETVVVSSWKPNRAQIIPEAFHTAGSWQLPSAWHRPRSIADHPLLQRLLSERNSIQINLAGTTIPLAILDIMETEEIRSWAAFPLLGADRRILGVVEVLDSRAANVFSPDEMALGDLLAKLVSAVYDRALLLERSNEISQQLSSLLHMIEEISADVSAPQSLKSVAQAFADLARAECCQISTYDPDADRLDTLARFEKNGVHRLDSIPTPRLVLAYPFAQEVIVLKKPRQMVVDDPSLDSQVRTFLEEINCLSLLVIPLLRENHCIGMIEILNISFVRVLDTQELDLLAVLAAHTARAISQSRTQTIQQHERHFSAALVEASKALNSSLNFSDVLEKILEQTMSVMHCQTANLMLIEGDSARVVEYIGYEGTSESLNTLLNKSLPLSTPTLRTMLATKKPVIVPDTSKQSDWVVLEGNEWLRSYAGAPLLVGGEVIGFLNLDSQHPGFFLAYETAPLEAFASIAASVLQNAQRYKTVQDRASELEIVRKATLSLTASLDLEDVLNTILRQSLDLFVGPRDGHIFLYKDNKLHFGTAMRGDGTRDEIWAEPREDGLTYTVARTGLPIIVDDMHRHPLFRNTPEDWTGSIIGLPLKYGESVVGVMNIAHHVPYQFKDHQIRVLSLLADQAAISVVNARLHHIVQEQSLTDPLTGLHNRRSFTQRLVEEVQRSERYDRPFSLAIMDLNGFKKINDTYGHPTGDQVLIRISRCLSNSVRNTDFLARYGGDEFALIMPETMKEIAFQLTDRLHEALRDCDYGVKEQLVLPITISIGIAQFPQDATSGERLIAAADNDLYEAKSIWRRSRR